MQSLGARTKSIPDRENGMKNTWSQLWEWRVTVAVRWFYEVQDQSWRQCWWGWLIDWHQMVDKTMFQNQEGLEKPSRTFRKERTSPLSWKVLLLPLLFPVAVTQFFRSLPTLKITICSLILIFLCMYYLLLVPYHIPPPILQKLPSYASAHENHCTLACMTYFLIHSLNTLENGVL